jgi:hypothetical protein
MQWVASPNQMYPPFDDQTMGRIRLEVTAVQEIIRRCATGELTLVSSEAITEELSKIPDIKKRLRVEKIISVAKEQILIDGGIVVRMHEIIAMVRWLWTRSISPVPNEPVPCSSLLMMI